MATTAPQDRRLILERDGLAAVGLEGQVAANRYIAVQALQCARAAAGLHAGPDEASEQTSQLLFGEAFDVLDVEGAWAFGQARRDRYVGYVRTEALSAFTDLPTHWVSALRTYAFAAPNLKSPIRAMLSMNALVTVDAEDGRFVHAVGAGWIFQGHLSPIGVCAEDPAAVALQYLGAPYQWGGRESLGLDCSALVQNALNACGLTCPRDSDQQFAELGRPVETEDLARNDLVFWKGHVAVMVDGERMVHANGHFMNVTLEPLAPAIARIAAAGAGQPIGCRRILP